MSSTICTAEAALPRAPHSGLGWRRWAAPALRASGVGWLAVALLGQLLFAAYIVLFYGGPAVRGRFEEWNRALPHGYEPGEWLSNLVVASHLLFTVAIVIGGAVQLLPVVRRRWPALHRWNGRLYLGSATVLSLGGLYMVLRHGTVGGPALHVSITINALLILAFAVLAYRDARARRIDAHRRWALRLFLAVSGVWMFRVGLMLWIMVNQGPVGFDPKTFTGPALIVLGFGQYLVPLAVLELYFRAQRAGAAAQLAMAGTLGALSLATAGGIAAAVAGMWLPRLQ